MRRLRGARALGWIAAVLLVGASGAGLAACAGGSNGEGSRPAGQDAALVPDDFAALPRPEGALPFGDPTVDGATTAQSFQVTGSGPEQLLAFYENALGAAGWEPSAPAAEVGDGDWRGSWARDDETLTVSAGPATGVGGVSSQLDLVLTH